MKSIKNFVDEYRLKVNGTSFWVPYPYKVLKLEQRREYSKDKPVVPPFKGRGTPKEVEEYLLAELKGRNASFSTGEEYRQFMASISLGVECSGFAYYVLDEHLKANYDTELKYHLYKPGKQLLEIYDHPKLIPPKGLSRKTVEAYPKWVNLAQIQDDWGNNPRYVVDSPTFVNEGSTVSVSISELKSGDLIGMMGYDGIGHHVVVVEADKGKITYAHSEGRHGREDDFGGVEYGEITVLNPSYPIEKQEWSDKLLPETHKFTDEPLRRLKVLVN
ncbi:MAG: hypothetical protein WDZ81_00160 [Candidatus Saccharimonadales bacterium]